MERSTCIICNKKRVRSKMIHHGQHWTCLSCVNVSDRELTDKPRISVLNLYAGVGGNRWLWPGGLDVTAVELNPKVAAEYKRNFPNDRLIIGDAHKYVLKHYKDYQVIWSSSPCQTHTRMNYIFPEKQYADMGLYQEIILLQNFYKGLFVVENVNPYYTPLIPANFSICRHLFWTNVPQLRDVVLPDFQPEFRGRNKGINVMDRQSICDWLGIVPGQKNIYLSGKRSAQVYRNAVYPLLGQSIMNDVLNHLTGSIAK